MRRRTLGLLAGAILALTPLLYAQPAAAETSLEVEAGFGEQYAPGRSVPVRVTIDADRLVRGTLVVRAPMAQMFRGGGNETGDAVAQLPVEVPGGSVKEFLLTVPTTGVRRSLEITVQLDAGDESATEKVVLETSADRDLVGLLPAVTPATLPGPVNLPADLGTAIVVPVDDALTAAAPASIAALGTLVAGPDELTRLPAPARQGILQWVDAGGRLVIDAAPGTQVEGLPAEWQPAANAGRVLAGLGEIRFSNGAAAAGRWAEVVEPSPVTLQDEFRNVPTLNLPFFEDISNAVARDAGFQVASLTGLVLILGAYFLVVGPIAYLVLRRKQRPELAWVVIPGLAVVFALVSFAAGTNLRRDTTAGQGTIITMGPAGSSATAYVGMLSRNGGDGQVTLPDGWTASPVDTTFTGGNANSVTVTTGGNSPAARIPLEAGQFGVLTASGPLDLAGQLEVRGQAAADGTVQGEVRNTTEQTLHEVGVFVENEGTNLGTLEPGETRTWTIKLDTGDSGQGADGGPAGFKRDPFAAPEAEVWPDALNPNGMPQTTGLVNSSLWWEAMRLSGWRLHMPGLITAAGWTRDATSPLDVRSDEEPRGRSVVVSRGVLGVAAGTATLPGSAVRRELMHTNDVRQRGDDAAPVASMTLRYVVPPGTDPSKLDVTIPENATRVEGWTPAGWQTLTSNAGVIVGRGDAGEVRVFPGPRGEAGAKIGGFEVLGGAGGAAIPIPPEAVQADAIYLRVEMRLDMGMFDPALFSLRGRS